MAAQSKKSKSSSSLLLWAVIALVVVVGAYFLSTNRSKVSTTNMVGTAGTKQSPKPVTSQNPTAVVQGAVSGPVGRNALKAYAGPGAGEVTLEWQRFFADGENFSIHYGTISKQYPFAATKVGYIDTYTIKGLTPGTKYFFALEGIRVGNVSAGSDGEVSMVAPATAVAVMGTAGPVGRNLLSAKPGPKLGQVTLSWKKSDFDGDKYHIVYGTAPGKYVYGVLNVIDVTPNDPNYSFTVGALTPGMRYYFALEPQRNGRAIYQTAEVSAVAP